VPAVAPPRPAVPVVPPRPALPVVPPIGLGLGPSPQPFNDMLAPVPTTIANANHFAPKFFMSCLLLYLQANGTQNRTLLPARH